MLTPLKRQLIWRWRRGFKATSKTFFSLAHGASGSYAEYMPDAAFRPLASTNGRMARAILNDKLLFERVLGRYVPVPTTLALIERGAVFSVSPDGPIRGVDDLLEYAQTHPLVLKPALGAKGKGVLCLRGNANSVCLDGAPVNKVEVAELISRLDDYLVTPWVEQATYAAEVFPEAGNSLRLITMRDPADDHRPFIAAAIQKFGTHASAPTDNWSRGALFVPVDVATGVLGAGLEELSTTDGRPVWHEMHPDTGAPIRGLQVPRWEELKGALLELLTTFPFFQYVGWDVLVTEEGFCILEGNPAPVVVSLQLTRPALGDPRVRRFAEYHKVKLSGFRRVLGYAAWVSPRDFARDTHAA